MGVPAFPVSESIGRSRTLKSWAGGAFERAWHTLLRKRQFLWGLALLVLIPIKDTRIVSAASMYDRAYQLFLRGDLIRTQREAEQGYWRYLNANPEQAANFQLLLARALISRGMNQDALKVLSVPPSILNNREATIEKLTLEGVANTYLRLFDKADRTLRDAVALCQPAVLAACSSVMLARGVLALEQGKLTQARQMFMESLSLARTGGDRRSETLALLNLATAAVRTEHYDEALDWANAAYRISVDAGWEDRTESAQGNLGWAYFELGDKEKALELFSRRSRPPRDWETFDFKSIMWISTAAYVYRDQGDLERAAQAYRKSLQLAKQINSQQDIINALEDLAHTDVMAGKLDDAGATLDELGPLVRASGSRVDELDIMLAQGEIAAARRQDAQAEAIFRTVEGDPASQTSMRLGAEHQLAKLYEVQGKTVAAESAYRTALMTFETARAELKNEDSKLPFLTNATPIYDDYIHFLVQQGRTNEALAAADQSRARTLAQGLGLETGKPSLKPAALRAGDVARKTGSTVLFYWLGDKQSYLWAITAKKTSLFPLPGQREIAPLIDRYRKALLEPALGREAASADGMALYRMLLGPAAGMIEASASVTVVCDGPLSLLNFETLIVPGSGTGTGTGWGRGRGLLICRTTGSKMPTWCRRLRSTCWRPQSLRPRTIESCC